MRSEIFSEIEKSRRRFLEEAAAAIGMTEKRLQQPEPEPTEPEEENPAPAIDSTPTNTSPTPVKTSARLASQRRVKLWDYLLGFFNYHKLRGSTH